MGSAINNPLNAVEPSASRILQSDVVRLGVFDRPGESSARRYTGNYVPMDWDDPDIFDRSVE